ncbi:MAG TPA: divalent metal cation transporter [Caldimonas sp.]|nr:divalent metal cation transporter [Caldimonas sp.]HEX4234671.1 divalent metal cation transporter [Caldimonas sp.]
MKNPQVRTPEKPSLLASLGPGIVTGAADDDPSGIATYSQAGAQFGYAMTWTLLFTYPLMVGVQLVSARIGRVSGHGLATNIRRHYPPWLLHAMVFLLLVANTINIAADLSAMGDAFRLLVGGSAHVYAALFGLACAALQVFIPYRRYVRVLKWLTLALLAYVATVFVIPLPWLQVASATFLPKITWSKDYITVIVAVFGTTISPYLFFWQASQEVEDQRADPNAKPLKSAPRQAEGTLRRIWIDTTLGMGVSNLVAFFIMVTTAATLHAHGVTNIQTAAQAAEALRPIAGNFAFALFSLGIIGTGLLAVPVLAGSASYAMAGALRWKNSLEDRPGTAREFYAVIVAATIGGIALGFTPIDPIKALFWSAVINGVISVPIMAVMMLVAARTDVMGALAVRGGLRAVGWLCTAVMAVAVVAMFVTMLQ